MKFRNIRHTIYNILRRTRTRTMVALGLLLILLPIVLIALHKPQSASGAWFNSDWSFRRAVSITNSSGSAQEDFQVQITLDTQILVTSDKLREDCSDLRITDYGGIVLPHWVEPNTCDTTATKVWVKAANIPSTGTTLYIYYGNPSASPVSYGTGDVFIREMDSAVVAWPLDETDSTQSYARAIHPSVDEGRNIVINGTLDSSTGWTLGPGLTITDGSAQWDGSQSPSASNLLQTSIPIVIGKQYEVSFTVSDYVSGTVKTIVGNTGHGTDRSGNGTYTQTITASGTSAFLYIQGSSTFIGKVDNIIAKQVDIPSSGDFDGTELLTDGDMEVSDVQPYWAAGNGATLTKETTSPHGGSRVMRVARSTINNPQAQQNSILTVGKTYRVKGYTRSDGNALPFVAINAGQNWTGTNSIDWQYFDFIGIAPSNGSGIVYFRAQTSTGNQYVEFDDVSVTEVSPLVGKNKNGVIPEVASGGHLGTAYSFDGTNDVVDIYSSDLNSVFNPDEGTLVAWAKVSDAGVWTDGVGRGIIEFSDGSGYIIVRRHGINQLRFARFSGGEGDTYSYTFSSPPTDWFMVAMSWSLSSDQLKLYVNGTQVGTTMSSPDISFNNLSNSRTVIGKSANGHHWKGQINDVRLYNRALTAEEIAAQYNENYDTQNYYTENYPGKELVRKYNDDVSVATLGTEEIGLSPILTWAFDEGHGETTNDKSQNTNNGSLGGSTPPAWQTAENCVSGNCLYFDGQSSKVTGSKTARDVKSISFWINPSVVADQGILDLDGGTHTISTDANGTLTASGFTNPTFYLNGQTHGSAPTLTPNVWNNITIVTATGFNTSSNFTLGTDGTNFFEGYIDEVQFYNYERSASQAQVGYNSAAIVVGGGSPSHLNRGLVAHWPLDDTDATQSYARVVNPSLAEGRNIVINGGFDSDTVWTKGTGWTIENGVATKVAGSSSNISQTVPLIVGKQYVVTYTISNYQAGSAVVTVGNTVGAGRTANGTYTQTLSPSSNTLITIFADASFTGSIDNISVKQINIPSSASISSENLLVDGDMEAADTSAWIAGNSSTISKQTATPHGGTQVLRVAYGSGTNPWASQLIGVIGKTYRVTGYARGDGNVNPRFDWGGVKWTGTSSTSWQFFDVTFVASATHFYATTITNSAGYTEWDDLTITEVSPLVGKPKNGVVPGVASGGHLGTAYSFDGTNDVVDIYSSDLNSAFNPDEGTLSAWAKVSDAGIWNDGEYRTIARIRSDGTNDIILSKHPSANSLRAFYWAGGVNNQIIDTSLSGTLDWFQIVIAWNKSSDEVKVYLNGNQIGSTMKGLGDWTGNLASTGNQSTAIGASGATGTNPWSGLINDVRLYNRALSASEIQDLYNYAPGPVAHWKFDEGTGTSAYDSSGNGNTGTWVGDTNYIWGDGVLGNGGHFNGTDNMVNSNSPLIQAYDTFTTSAWIKVEDYGDGLDTIYNRTILSNRQGNKGIIFGVFPSKKLFLNLLGSPSTVSSTSDVEINTWTHVAATASRNVNSATVSLYINGILDKTTTIDLIDFTTVTQNMRIGWEMGAGPGNRLFKGQIDDVKIYNYARSQSQILEDMHGTRSFSGVSGGNVLPTPIAHYKFDEQSGTTANNSGIGGSALNGTLNGATWKTDADCKVNGCLSFDGSDDYVNTSITATTTGNASVSFWTKLIGGNTGQYIFSTMNGDSSCYQRPSTFNSGRIGFYNGSAYVYGTRNLNDDNFHHIAVIDRASPTRSRAVFVDGKMEINWTELSGAVGYSSNTCNVGSIGSYVTHQDFFNGYIDEFKIYNTALTEDQVKLDMNAGSSLNFGTTSEAEADQLSDGAGAPPVAYWSFDDGTGTSAADKSGNGNTGTLTNGPVWTEGKYGQALNFDGTNDFVTGGTTGMSASQGTVSLWFNASTIPTTTKYMFAEFETNTNSRIYIGIDSTGKLGSAWGGSSTFKPSTTTIVANTWYQTAITWDNGTFRQYLNGQQILTGSYSGLSTIANCLTIGAHNYCGGPSNSNFLGLIDEVKIYDYARTPAQIAYDFNRGAPVAWYRFDECQGTTAYDSSGNGNNGTITAGDTSGANDSVGNCEGDAGSMWADGKLGKWNGSLEFDGTNDYVSIPDSDSVSLSNSAWSAFAWVNINGSLDASKSVIRKMADDYGLGMNTRRVWCLQEATQLTTGTQISSNEWYHFGCVFDGSTLRSYLDGTEQGSTPASVGTDANGELHLGGKSTGQVTQGKVDDVRIYNYALSPEQVRNVYNGGSAVNFSE